MSYATSYEWSGVLINNPRNQNRLTPAGKDDMDEYDLLLNPSPVCPHCGKAMPDAWELDMSDGDEIEIECGNCDKPMNIECRITVEYTTSKPK